MDVKDILLGDIGGREMMRNEKYIVKGLDPGKFGCSVEYSDAIDAACRPNLAYSR